MPGTVHVTEGPPETLSEAVLQICYTHGFRVIGDDPYSFRAKKGSALILGYMATFQKFTDDFDYVNFMVEITGDEETDWRLAVTWKSPRWWAGKMAAEKTRKHAKLLGDSISDELRRRNVKINYVQQL